MSPLISKLPFLNIITEVLLIHVPRVKFTLENENTASLILHNYLFFNLYSDLYKDSKAFNKETNESASSAVNKTYNILYINHTIGQSYILHFTFYIFCLIIAYAFHSLIISEYMSPFFRDILMVYIYLFCFGLFCIFTFEPSLWYLYVPMYLLCLVPDFVVHIFNCHNYRHPTSLDLVILGVHYCMYCLFIYL